MDFLWIALVLLPVIVVVSGSHLYTIYTYRHSRVHPTSCGLTGAQVARLLLDRMDLSQIGIKETQGFLSDGYDMATSTIRLSSDNFHSNSVAATGIAAHEVGHVLQAYHTDQHAGFTLMNPRLAIALTRQASWGAVLAGLLLFVGLLSQWQSMAYFGVIILIWAVGCSLLTLPVEVNASRRALALLRSETIFLESELIEARKVLRAATWAYVATAGTALVQVLRDILRRDSR